MACSTVLRRHADADGESDDRQVSLGRKAQAQRRRAPAPRPPRSGAARPALTSPRLHQVPAAPVEGWRVQREAGESRPSIAGDSGAAPATVSEELAASQPLGRHKRLGRRSTPPARSPRRAPALASPDTGLVHGKLALRRAVRVAACRLRRARARGCASPLPASLQRWSARGVRMEVSLVHLSARAAPLCARSHLSCLVSVRLRPQAADRRHHRQRASRWHRSSAWPADVAVIDRATIAAQHRRLAGRPAAPRSRRAAVAQRRPGPEHRPLHPRRRRRPARCCWSTACGSARPRSACRTSTR